jgi:lipopolysaccharide export LptBFGC system permease protein LptF
MGILISGIPTSYIFGIIPALLAGKVTSFILRTDGRHEIILVALTGLLTGLAYWLFMGVMSGDLISGEWTANGIRNYLITCFVPTMICWILARKARKRTRVTS